MAGTIEELHSGELHAKLERKTAECEELRRLLDSAERRVQAFRDEAIAAREEARLSHRTGVVALRAAQAQMMQLQGELARRIQMDLNQHQEGGYANGYPPNSTQGTEVGGAWSPAGSQAGGPQAMMMPQDASPGGGLREKHLQQDVRHLQLDLAYYQQKVEELQVERHQRMQELSKMRQELTSTKDQLEYARQQVRHAEIELLAKTGTSRALDELDSLGGFAKTRMEHVERKLREKMEKRNNRLSEKVQKCEAVIAEQKGNSQRLERRLSTARQLLVLKERQLQGATSQAGQLQSTLRHLQWRSAMAPPAAETLSGSQSPNFPSDAGLLAPMEGGHGMMMDQKASSTGALPKLGPGLLSYMQNPPSASLE